jgi:hypothetical protein
MVKTALKTKKRVFKNIKNMPEQAKKNMPIVLNFDSVPVFPVKHNKLILC